MMKNSVDLKKLRNKVLTVTALAIVPFSANALLTDHDVVDATSDPSIESDKQQSGDRDTLAKRFGDYSGITTESSRTERINLSVRNDVAVERNLQLP